jgi:hypothetical protein
MEDFDNNVLGQASIASPEAIEVSMPQIQQIHGSKRYG